MRADISGQRPETAVFSLDRLDSPIHTVGQIGEKKDFWQHQQCLTGVDARQKLPHHVSDTC
jgi:hypothetical protein